MADQAEHLRKLVGEHTRTPLTTRVIAVSSGKGGVGKSNFTLNFALELIRAGKRVVIIDADVGFANIDVLIGLNPSSSLVDLVERRLPIWDVIETGPRGLKFLPGGSGFQDFVDLRDDQIEYLLDQLAQLDDAFDVILIDMGAGFHQHAMRLLLSCNEMIVVSTPEPTAMADAYALIKMVCGRPDHPPIQLVVNRAQNVLEGKETSEKLTLVTKQFLGVDVQSIGMILDDPLVSKSVKGQVPFSIAYPHAIASRCVRQIVANYDRRVRTSVPGGGLSLFLTRVRGWLEKST